MSYKQPPKVTITPAPTTGNPPVTTKNKAGFFNGIGGVAVNAGLGIAQSLFNHHLADKAAQKQYDRQLEFWNMQNEYNKPSAQRQRMQDAGFNPSAVVGEVAGGQNAQQLSTVPGNEYAQSGFMKLESLASVFETMARIENIGAQTGLATAQTSSEAIRQVLLGLGIDEKRVDILIKEWEEKKSAFEYSEMPKFFEHRNAMYDLDEKYRAKEFDFLDASIQQQIASANYTDALALTENVLRGARLAYQNAITDEARQNIAYSVAQQSLVPLMRKKLEEETDLLRAETVLTQKNYQKVEEEMFQLMDSREFKKIIAEATASEAEANAVIAQIKAKQHSMLAENLSGGANILDYLSNLADSVIFSIFAKN